MKSFFLSFLEVFVIGFFAGFLFLEGIAVITTFLIGEWGWGIVALFLFLVQATIAKFFAEIFTQWIKDKR